MLNYFKFLWSCKYNTLLHKIHVQYKQSITFMDQQIRKGI